MGIAVSSHQIYVMHCILEPTSGMAGQLQLTSIVVYRAGRARSCHCHAHSPQHVRNLQQFICMPQMYSGPKICASQLKKT